MRSASPMAEGMHQVQGVSERGANSHDFSNPVAYALLCAQYFHALDFSMSSKFNHLNKGHQMTPRRLSGELFQTFKVVLL